MYVKLELVDWCTLITVVVAVAGAAAGGVGSSTRLAMKFNGNI